MNYPEMGAPPNHPSHETILVLKPMVKINRIPHFKKCPYMLMEMLAAIS
jgi:hypothetical protein